MIVIIFVFLLPVIFSLAIVLHYCYSQHLTVNSLVAISTSTIVVVIVIAIATGLSHWCFCFSSNAWRGPEPEQTPSPPQPKLAWFASPPKKPNTRCGTWPSTKTLTAKRYDPKPHTKSQPAQTLNSIQRIRNPCKTLLEALVLYKIVKPF